MIRFASCPARHNLLPVLFSVAVLFCAVGAAAQTGATAVPIPLPPMGWSSWNSFSNTVDSQVIQQQARAMVSSGMQKAGYQYINIDEGWWLGERDAQGNIVVPAKAWPALAPGEHDGDMSNIVRFIHGLGLKAGIYTDAGESGCSMFPDVGPVYLHTGSEGHYDQDFLQFAKWGFDYVKVDWCGGNKENLDPAVQYAEIAHAIDRAAAMTGHRLYYSLCEWGKNSPWTWAPNVGGAPADIWRTSGDIVAPVVAGTKNANRKVSFPKMLSNFDQGIHPEAEHTGFYNDPDMMVVGMPGLDDEQNRTHMSLWAISAAPLIVGADLAKLSPATLSTLTNAAVLAIDQDPAGLQAVRVNESGTPGEVWAKALAEPGKRAVLLLNRGDSPAQVAVRWSDLGLAGSPARVQDVWSGKQIQTSGDSYSATVPAQDSVLLQVDGTEGKLQHYQPAASDQPGAVTTGHAVRFTSLEAHSRVARIEITYSNPGTEPRSTTLRVNDQNETRVAFPPTGQSDGAVWIQAIFDRAGAENSLTLSTTCEPGPTIRTIAVQ